MDSQRVQIHIHHGGNFQEMKGGRVRYMWGKVDVWLDCDEDTLNVFSFKNFSKELGYDNITNVWWLDLSKKFKDGLSVLNEDKDLLEAIEVAKRNRGELHLYYEHPISKPEVMDITAILSEVLKGADAVGDSGNDEICKGGLEADSKGEKVGEHCGNEGVIKGGIEKGWKGKEKLVEGGDEGKVGGEGVIKRGMEKGGKGKEKLVEGGDEGNAGGEGNVAMETKGQGENVVNVAAPQSAKGQEVELREKG